jgi:sterol desaturase/sphingolipid hydroxylase (fatty acid hydroxylase superfamily)
MTPYGTGLEGISAFVRMNEAAIRLGCFAGCTAVMACWEALAPRRVRAFSRWRRWPHNLGIAAVDTLAARVLIPTAAVGFAIAGQAQGWGLFNNVNFPGWAKIVVSIVVLDLAIYLQHVVFHAVPVLWRLHRMHHTDLDFDVTTGVRFHPLEILLSAAVKIAAVVALGAPMLAVVIFEVLLNAATMFNHGNVRLPEWIEKPLRWVVVTPDMHRVHHSVIPVETNSNFGFNLSWWDRLLGTYRAQPARGHDAMIIGLDAFRDPVQLRLDRMLMQPFARRGKVDRAGAE